MQTIIVIHSFIYVHIKLMMMNAYNNKFNLTMTVTRGTMEITLLTFQGRYIRRYIKLKR